MPIVNGVEVDEFTYNEMLDNMLDTGKSMDGFTMGGTSTPGMFQGGLDFLGKNKDGIGTAMGLAGLAMNAYNMFGPGMDMHKKNMQLADQNIAANKEALDRRARLNDAYAKSFGGGLAASAAKVG